MKKVQIIVDSVLAAAVVALFVLHFAKPRTATSETEVQIDGEHMPIAYINMDSILNHYTFAVEANDQLQNSYENSMVQLDDKGRAFQKEYDTFQKEVADFQRKVESGAFLSQQRAESEQARLQKKQERLMQQQQEMETLRQQLADNFYQQQQDLTIQLNDSIQNFLREFNADGRYHMILNDAVVLNKVAGYDITMEVVDGLNGRID